MPKRGQSRMEANREIRREALSEQLRATGLLPQILKNIKLIEDLKKEGTDWQRLKAATDLRLALLRKIMPDLKSTELTGADGTPLVVRLDKADGKV